MYRRLRGLYLYCVVVSTALCQQMRAETAPLEELGDTRIHERRRRRDTDGRINLLGTGST